MPALEALSEEESYLYAILSDPSGLDLAEFCFPDPEQPDGCWRAWAFQWPWYRDDSPLSIDQCVAAGELVLTQRGHIPIENVIVGDEVWTHRNRWRKVTYVWDKGDRSVVRVTAPGNTAGVLVTPDHKMWTRGGVRRMVGGVRSVCSDEPAFLGPKDFSARQGERYATLLASPYNFGAETTVPPLSRLVGCGKRTIPTDQSEDFLWLCGVYVAEGSVQCRGQHTLLSVHVSEVDQVVAAARSCGLRPRVALTTNPVVVNVIIPGQSLASWFVTHFGKLAHGKRLPSWALGMEPTLRHALLAGLLFGDGHTRSTRRNPQKTCSEYTTVSKALAYDVRLLAQSLGRGASVGLKRKACEVSHIQGRTVTTRDTYRVGLYVEDSEKSRLVLVDDHIWAAHYDVKPEGRARVYDIEVEEDHSFVVNGQVVSNCGRAIGKSQGIKMRAFSFPFNHTGQEMVITAPENIHLKAITQLIENMFLDIRLGREMLDQRRTKGAGITHRPFNIQFGNNARIMALIPQRDGKGIKGTHPIALEMDEAQDYPDPGWIELTETLKRGVVGAKWRAHGVTRGVRDYFYKLTQPGSGWRVHNYTALHRPNWTDQERQEKIEIYGSKNSPDYRRNILGQHGDASNALFVLARLMACVDLEESSDYNLLNYYNRKITAEGISEVGGNVEYFLQFPSLHKDWKITWAGMDVGYCADADTEIFTQRGWLRSDELTTDDLSLGIDPATGKSEWQAVSDVYREHFEAIAMVEMKGQSFDALVTPHHKWLTRNEAGSWCWKQTRELNTKDAIPLTVGRADLPVDAIYSDDFVELVAWFWTEGWWVSGSSAGISQSPTANGQYCDRIRHLLNRLCGEPGAAYGPGGREVSHFWREYVHPLGCVDFHFRGPVVAALKEVVNRDKVPSMDFLTSLTGNQLELFINTGIDADGWRTKSGARKMELASEPMMKAFEAACALAGIPTSVHYNAKRCKYHISLLGSRVVWPTKASRFSRSSDQAMTVRPVEYSGIIWCPTVSHGNWLARRNGSVYFTGNTNHPSEILVFGEEAGGSERGPTLRLLTRLHLERVHHDDQARIVQSVIDYYGCTFALDKMQPVSEPVLTPRGWVPIGSVKVGDEVIGSGGQPTRVTGVYPQRDRRVMKVTFTDGSWTRCGPEHLWQVKHTQQSSSQVVTTEDLLPVVNTTKSKQWTIPTLTAPVSFYQDTELPVDPYLLGALLGDGNIREHSLRFSSLDTEILQEVEDRLPDDVIIRYLNRCDYVLVDKDLQRSRDSSGRYVSGNSNSLLQSLRQLDLTGKLSHEKHIPSVYLTAGAADRLLLLQGLMDTDGYVDRNGTHVGIRLSSEKLIQGIVEIVESLGGSAWYKAHATSCNKKPGRTAYRATIRLPADVNPFRLSRKRDRVKSRRNPLRRYIARIEPDGEEESVCLRVEASDHLYVTRHHVLTHNTGVGLPLFQELQRSNPAIVHKIKGYGFSEKLIVDLDQSIEVDEMTGDVLKEAGIHKSVLEHSSDKLRELVDQHRVMLPWDRDLVAEFQGQTYTIVKGATDMYGRRNYSKGNFHALDAAKMATLAYTMSAKEQFFKELTHRPDVIDIFGGGSPGVMDPAGDGRVVVW